jgi:hypothetical protein
MSAYLTLTFLFVMAKIELAHLNIFCIELCSRSIVWSAVYCSSKAECVGEIHQTASA